MSEPTIVPERMRSSVSSIRRSGRKENPMAIENNSDEVIPTPNESYYEELACSEEIYLEETEEELRSALISDSPQDDRPTRALDEACELYREAQASLFRE
jgi:hypothetical protein